MYVLCDSDWSRLHAEGLLLKEALLLNVLRNELPSGTAAELGQETDTGCLTYLLGYTGSCGARAPAPPYLPAVRVHLTLAAVRDVRAESPLLLPLLADVLSVDRAVVMAMMGDADLTDDIAWLDTLGFRAPRQAHSSVINGLGFDYGLTFRVVRE